MIIPGTKLNVIDNSGAKLVKCIRVNQTKNHNVGIIGSVLLVHIIKRKHSRIIKKKDLYYGLVTMIQQDIIRKDGSVIKFYDNRILLFTVSHKFLGTRIYGVVLQEIQTNLKMNKKDKQKYLKVMSYSSSII